MKGWFLAAPRGRLFSGLVIFQLLQVFIHWLKCTNLNLGQAFNASGCYPLQTICRQVSLLLAAKALPCCQQFLSFISGEGCCMRCQTAETFLLSVLCWGCLLVLSVPLSGVLLQTHYHFCTQTGEVVKGDWVIHSLWHHLVLELVWEPVVQLLFPFCMRLLDFACPVDEVAEEVLKFHHTLKQALEFGLCNWDPVDVFKHCLEVHQHLIWVLVLVGSV